MIDYETRDKWNFDRHWITKKTVLIKGAIGAYRLNAMNDAGSGGHFKNIYKPINLVEISLLNNLHIFLCMGKLFYQEDIFEIWHKLFTYVLKDTIFMYGWNF